MLGSAEAVKLAGSDDGVEERRGDERDPRPSAKRLVTSFVRFHLGLRKVRGCSSISESCCRTKGRNKARERNVPSGALYECQPRRPQYRNFLWKLT